MKKLYYADYYDKIPFGIVNKQICGCGASSFALENQDKVILIVPNVSMINNKLFQYPNARRYEKIIGIYNNVDVNSVIPQYLESTEIPKIMVTYDSFFKLVEFIDDSFHIIVDEFQCLLDDYNYRSKAINKLLDLVFKYPKLSFISATPTEKKYLPTILKSQPYTSLNWNNLTPVIVIPTQTSRVVQAVRSLIQKYKAGLIEINKNKSNSAYFFINSIDLIKTIIKKSGLLPEEVRIICSDNPKNKSKLTSRFKIQNTEDEEKMFNFVTSTCFKGSDIYSDSGIAYVISNNYNKNSLVSIDTQIYQISGRIRSRNNPFRNTIYHIFNETPLKLTQLEFSTLLASRIKDTNTLITLYKKGTEEEQLINANSFRKTGIGENYLRILEGSIEFDELLQLQEERIYDTIIKPYQSGVFIVDCYEKDSRYEVKKDNLVKTFDFCKSDSFYNICKFLIEGDISLEFVEKSYPEIAIAFNILGSKKIKALGYQKDKINREIEIIRQQDNINEAIKKQFSTGFYSLKTIKSTLTVLYDKLSFKKNATAIDIESVFNVSVSTKSINGKQVKGYNIL